MFPRTGTESEGIVPCGMYRVDGEKRKIKESRGRKIWQDSPPFFRSKEKIMKNHIEITNFNDPNLDLYARLSEVQLLRYADFCCGESEGNRTGSAGGV